MDEVWNEAFETLKGILVKASMLKLLDFDKDFEIHFDASNFAIGGVLMQIGRLVAFESKTLSETQWKSLMNLLILPHFLYPPSPHTTHNAHFDH